ncbi:hypothetical protein BD324DRAFT_376444 [Kockovaella imperatae]|uniref:DNA-directed RNA polymerase III subunit RPC3 n=1 Tax=Kockovaella imperatae TaxID=4999 RepID=A0A1Y1UMD0_9TREE|nr:hypothetical protein BD324DRAFT_376444 [Kockovaella imperatae]ORX38677.1 hypothetical protein BD324DRAFT_376444 [Kockovaella imperatae]
MAAGKEVVRLCQHIIRQSFGEEVCRVASTLLNRGRLTSTTLIALSGLRAEAVLTSLVILCQHNLVLTNGGSSLKPPRDEVYEFNVEICLLRLRWGRILMYTYERLGQEALEVVKQILLFGKMSLPDIVHACGGQDSPSPHQVTEATINLVRQSFIHPTSPIFQVSMSDQIERRFAMKREEKKAAGESGLLRPIDVENMTNQCQWEINVERSKLREMERVLISKEKPGKKKKSRAAEEFDYSLRSDVLLEVNYDRYGVLMRDELIVKATEDRWNRGAAEVVRGVLEATLDRHSELKASRSYTPVNVNQILDKIPAKVHKYIFAGITLQSQGSSKSILDYVRQYLMVISGEDLQPSSGTRFLVRAEGADEMYTVELQGICVRLRANLMMDLVRERLGPRPARVLATVAKAHHISEQTIRDCAMIPLKEARIALAELQKMSLIETSEIPKSLNAKRANLTATSEHHRWGMDLPRAYNAMLANVYKTLGNILQRRASEYARREAAVIREAAATAMHRGGRDVLMQKDQEELKELDDVVRKLTLAEERCEMVVFIIRDLPGWPTPNTQAIPEP